MALYIGSARRDENGRYVNGKAGDQDGVEVSTQPYYMHSKGWYCFRFKLVEYANKMAEAMRQACKNPNIGYDQNERLDIMTSLKKYGSLEKISEPTECDCGTLIRACIYQATGIDVGEFYTGNQSSVLAKSGLFDDKISVTSSSVLYNGDILVTKRKGHTATVVSGRERSIQKSETSNTTTGNAVKPIKKKVSDTKMPTIRYGSRGKAVMIWQIIIGAEADGIFGKDTEKATKEFQEKHGLEVDGIAGTNSWREGLESV